MPLKLQRCARSFVRRNARGDRYRMRISYSPSKWLHYTTEKIWERRKEGLTDSKAVKKDPNSTEPMFACPVKSSIRTNHNWNVSCDSWTLNHEYAWRNRYLVVLTTNMHLEVKLGNLSEFHLNFNSWLQTQKLCFSVRLDLSDKENHRATEPFLAHEQLA